MRVKPVRLRDFVLAENCFFSVVGYRNEGRIKCFLRYVPDPHGDREREGVRYRKLSHDEAVELAGRYNVDRYYEDGIFRIPEKDVVEVFKPEERLSEAMEYDEVKKIVEFFDGLPRNKMGTTGSRLLGLASHDSDVDFVVYGRWWFEARERIRRGILRGVLSEPDGDTWEFIYRKRKITLPFEVFIAHERRKYHRAFIGSTYFDLLYVRDYDELDREIPEEKGRKIGKAEINSVLLDDSLTFDYPAYYPISNSEIKAVLCYTHTFVGQVRRGEKIVARGDVEEIGGERYLIVGTKREVEDEYVISATLLEKLGLTDSFLSWRDGIGGHS